MIFSCAFGSMIRKFKTSITVIYNHYTLCVLSKTAILFKIQKKTVTGLISPSIVGGGLTEPRLFQNPKWLQNLPPGRTPRKSVDLSGTIKPFLSHSDSVARQQSTCLPQRKPGIQSFIPTNNSIVVALYEDCRFQPH